MVAFAVAVEAYLLTRPVLSLAQQLAVWAGVAFAVWGIALALGADYFERALGPATQDELGPAFELESKREDDAR